MNADIFGQKTETKRRRRRTAAVRRMEEVQGEQRPYMLQVKSPTRVPGNENK